MFSRLHKWYYLRSTVLCINLLLVGPFLTKETTFATEESKAVAKSDPYVRSKTSERTMKPPEMACTAWLLGRLAYSRETALVVP